MGYIPSGAFPTALGEGSDEKFKEDVRKFRIRASLLTSQSSRSCGHLRSYAQ